MPGLLRGIARTAVISGTATAVSNRVSRNQAERWAAEQEQPSNTQSSEENSDSMALLKQLSELHSSGVLTDEEFEAKKAEILNKI